MVWGWGSSGLSDREIDWIKTTLANINRGVSALNKRVQQMEAYMSGIDDALKALEAQVQENTDVEASAVQAISHLADLIQQNAGDPAAVNELAAKLKASADALGAAVAANTPAEEPPPA